MKCVEAYSSNESRHHHHREAGSWTIWLVVDFFRKTCVRRTLAQLVRARLLVAQVLFNHVIFLHGKYCGSCQKDVRPL